ncbi:hypothetical protein DW091_05045 [Eubacterium sp. AM05-23]|uniref:hypothetical protein n=1 Tax=Eubacterium TaxID=1730 RepID=UPI000735CE87|nr:MULTISPECIES: hypothetical protein [Eubacterium]RHO59933.1 hypothetical protein DW091_05045 [Eubacterium sp. AM05-23]
MKKDGFPLLSWISHQKPYPDNALPVVYGEPAKLKYYVEFWIYWKEKILLDDYLQDWLFNVKYYTLDSGSFDRVESTYLARIKGKFENTALNEVTSRQIQDLINKDCENLSFSTVKK